MSLPINAKLRVMLRSWKTVHTARFSSKFFPARRSLYLPTRARDEPMWSTIETNHAKITAWPIYTLNVHETDLGRRIHAPDEGSTQTNHREAGRDSERMGAPPDPRPSHPQPSAPVRILAREDRAYQLCCSHVTYPKNGESDCAFQWVDNNAGEPELGECGGVTADAVHGRG